MSDQHAEYVRRWEFHTQRANGVDLDFILEEFSQQGWELVSVVHLAHDLVDSPYRLFLKRRTDGSITERTDG